MQNRYLFKAKRIKDGQWVEGAFYIEPYTDCCYIIQWNSTGLGFNEFIEVDGETICQCTGLKDKNGNLIWENDIVAYWDSYSTESGLAEADCIGKVVWDDETISFQVTNRLSAESYEVLGDECSVIGNVFDNPELLEE
jgi:uncharacterized phage protein (TIGR01671 family)|nr:MAG TPA: YopX protein [Bacteriophage sp.]